MATRTNAWIILENKRALAWWDWYQWYDGGQKGKEPPLDDWGKNSILRLISRMTSIGYCFQAFRQATIQQRRWRMFSLWDITKEQADEGYTQYGPNYYAVAGFWEWEDAPRSNICKLMPYYNWRPDLIEKYIFEEKLMDVSLLFGQPPKELPIEKRTADKTGKAWVKDTGNKPGISDKPKKRRKTRIKL